jgi:chromosome segregation ATPase
VAEKKKVENAESTTGKLHAQIQNLERDSDQAKKKSKMHNEQVIRETRQLKDEKRRLEETVQTVTAGKQRLDDEKRTAEMARERAVAEKNRIEIEKTRLQAENRRIQNEKENIVAARDREVAEKRRLTGVVTEAERKRIQAENNTNRLVAELEATREEFEITNEQLTAALNRCTTLVMERERLGADALGRSQEISSLQARIDEQTQNASRLQDRIAWLSVKVVDLKGQVG